MDEREINFDGIVGPTHNYAGLSHGNLASTRNRASVSNPKAAALEGLAKMRQLADMGIPQAVLPPHERPHVPTLRQMGFTGSDAQVIERAYSHDPVLLAACSSASAMWTANAATVSPSADCADSRVHFTAANLASMLHRSIEAPTTSRILRAIFADDSAFAHHDPLPAILGDEGAANHTRFANGMELFVYGRRALGSRDSTPTRFPARQTLEGSEAIARSHGLDPVRTVFLQQNPLAIDAGAFHNDVVAVGNGDVLFYHEQAYLESLAGKLPGIRLICVPTSAVSLDDAVRSYLFNSQLVTTPDGTLTLIAPRECQEVPAVREYLATANFARIVYVDVRQSMRNGGGPACLRLRVTLTGQELEKVKANVFFDAALHSRLDAWIRKHYREELKPDDWRDPRLLDESRVVLDELTKILAIGSVYEFQHQ